MRNTPEITFVFDESVERGAHLNELFRSIEKDAAASGKGENDEL
jgi:ribosome-binding factor A